MHLPTTKVILTSLCSQVILLSFSITGITEVNALILRRKVELWCGSDLETLELIQILKISTLSTQMLKSTKQELNLMKKCLLNINLLSLNLLVERVHQQRPQHQPKVLQQKERLVELQLKKIYPLRKRRSKLLLISPKRQNIHSIQLMVLLIPHSLSQTSTFVILNQLFALMLDMLNSSQCYQSKVLQFQFLLSSSMILLRESLLTQKN